MQQLVRDFAEAIRVIDQSGIPYKEFQPGVGPYGEPQVVRKCLEILKQHHPERYGSGQTRRVPDILIPNRWAVEAKIVRPFGDNGKEAEHWSQNLLHPYDGNVSSIGDAFKLQRWEGPERKAILVLGYEHDPPVIDLSVLVEAFELVSRKLLMVPLGPRVEVILPNLVHPVHQRARVIGWDIAASR